MSAEPLARRLVHRSLGEGGSLSEGGRIVIIGAGPTGLGAAWRLHELDHHNWALYESADHPGGLASSVLDEQGFTWDLGGHVLFSHYKYFDNVMDTALGDAWIEHVREAWVWIRDRWVPYPFQNNIWRLPNEDLIACLSGPGSIFREPLETRRDRFETGCCSRSAPGCVTPSCFHTTARCGPTIPRRLDVGLDG